jgi:hypothetical protein
MTRRRNLFSLFIRLKILLSERGFVKSWLRIAGGKKYYIFKKILLRMNACDAAGPGRKIEVEGKK